MKKKILIVILIIVLSFVLGLVIHFLATFIKNKEIEKQYTTIIGVIENIENDYIYILTEDKNFKNNYKQLYFSIPEMSEQTWKIGDKLEIKFHNEHISEDGFIANPILKYLGKARLFTNIANIPVSNSGFLGGNYVFKSFYAYNTSLNIKNFEQKENFYLKKIISYEEYLEYQKIIPEIRTLTEDDFINYYLIILLSTDVENVYTLEGPEENIDSLTLNILKHKSISKPTTESEPTYSGVSIVVPNRCDFNIENINLITKSTSN